MFKNPAYKTSDFHKLRRVQILVVSKERKVGRDNPMSTFHGLAFIFLHEHIQAVTLCDNIIYKNQVVTSGYIPPFQLSEALKANQNHLKAANY